MQWTQQKGYASNILVMYEWQNAKYCTIWFGDTKRDNPHTTCV